MSERVMFIASAEIPAEKKGAILADPKFDFLPHPTTLQPPTIKAPSKNKRTMLSTSPPPPAYPFIRFPHRVHNFRIEKQIISILSTL